MLVGASEDMVVVVFFTLALFVFLLTACACLPGFESHARRYAGLYTSASTGMCMGVGIGVYAEAGGNDLVADGGEGGGGGL